MTIGNRERDPLVPSGFMSELKMTSARIAQSGARTFARTTIPVSETADAA